MSQTQRRRRLRRRQVASQTRSTGSTRPTPAAVAVVTGSLLAAGTLAVVPIRADAADRDVHLVADLTPGNDDYSSDGPLVALGDQVLWAHDDHAASGRELWASDGTAAGTRRLTDLVTGPRGSAPDDLTAVGDTLFFGAYGDDGGQHLWRTDGTTAGTVVVAAGPGSPAQLTAAGDSLFFTADDGGGRQLWVSDGTSAGTVRLSELAPADPGSGIEGLTAVGSRVYFSADDGTHGHELWVSDGTPAGTRLVEDVGGSTPADGSRPEQLTAVGTTLYFVADDGSHGRELWRSDGTPAGTRLVRDLTPDSQESPFTEPGRLTALGGTLLFEGYDAAHGRELWRSDGTAAGTRLVADLNPGEEDSGRDGSVVLGGALLFAATDADHGYELWRSDGTTRGTHLVADLQPGDYGPGSTPAHLRVLGDAVFFSADDGTHGAELWRTDGTAAGTGLVADIAPGSAGAEPSGLVAAGERLFFTADDRTHGREPWTTTSAATVTPVVANTAAPTIAGTPAVGRTLTASTGTWTPSGLTFGYAWSLDETPVPGATARTFVVPAGAVGQTVTVRITARRAGLTTSSATSRPTAAVVRGTLRLARAPRAAGRLLVGRTLRLATGAVSPAATRLRFAWLRNGRAIAGARRSTYVLGPKDKGRRIQARVTYRRAGYAPLVVTTTPAGRVRS